VDDSGEQQSYPNLSQIDDLRFRGILTVGQRGELWREGATGKRFGVISGTGSYLAAVALPNNL
jgi:hypothetical protein